MTERWMGKDFLRLIVWDNFKDRDAAVISECTVSFSQHIGTLRAGISRSGKAARGSPGSVFIVIVIIVVVDITYITILRVIRHPKSSRGCCAHLKSESDHINMVVRD